MTRLVLRFWGATAVIEKHNPNLVIPTGAEGPAVCLVVTRTVALTGVN
jgi:hypothetical protein